jgi:uncharacterized protein YndB with AHSA1/START domain
MPTNKDFKRLVRARMQKTGEAYTAARAQLLRRPVHSAIPRRPPAATPADFARLAGMSDAAVKARTGCTWERWVGALDYVKASTWSHRDIARHIAEKYRLSSWWSQTVTVGYERIKGLRAIGQRRDSGFDANKCRTFGVPVHRLYRAFRDARTRDRWLEGATDSVRTTTPDRSIRMQWPGGTTVQATFLPKGRSRSIVQVRHGEFPTREAALAQRAFWGDRLDALERLLLPADA